LLIAPEHQGDYYGYEHEKGNRDFVKIRTRTGAFKHTSKRKGLKKKFFLTTGVLFLFLLFGIYYTSLTVAVARQGYELEKLQNEIERIQNENERLEFMVVQMSSLNRIEKEAVEKLGMKKPDLENIVFVSNTEAGKGKENASEQKLNKTEKQNSQDRKEEVTGNEFFSKLFDNIFKAQRAEAFMSK